MKLHMIYESELDLSVLYHGTSKKNLDSILRHGLDPNKSNYTKYDEGAWIYLSENPRVAAKFAAGGSIAGDKDINNKVLLEIRLPPELQKKLVTDMGEFIRSPFLIPPQYIKVLD